MDHVDDAVQSTQQQLATQLQQIQLMMQTMQMHYNAGPHVTLQYYGGCGYHSNQPSYHGQGGRGEKKTVIGAEAVVIEPTVILHIIVGLTECVPIQVKTSGPQQMATKRTQYGVTRCLAVIETGTSDCR